METRKRTKQEAAGSEYLLATILGFLMSQVSPSSPPSKELSADAANNHDDGVAAPSVLLSNNNDDDDDQGQSCVESSRSSKVLAYDETTTEIDSDQVLPDDDFAETQDRIDPTIEAKPTVDDGETATTCMDETTTKAAAPEGVPEVAPARGQKRPLESTTFLETETSWKAEWLNPGTARITFLVKGASICLSGRGAVRISEGTVSGHGFLLQPSNQQWHHFECPAWSNWLTLECKSETASVEVRSRSPGGSCSDEDETTNATTAQVLHGPTPPPPHLEIQIDDGNSALASFSLHKVDDPLSRPTVIFPAWRTTADKMLEKYRQDASTNGSVKVERIEQGNNVIAVAGAKGVGKSTYVRYLVHRFLSLQKPVYVLDGDTGQAEFGPPGLLTLTHLTKPEPLWSLPHHHMLTGHAQPKNPLVPTNATQTAVFYGGTTSQLDPGRYLQAMRRLMEIYSTKAYSRDIPLIVNLDGWVKGLGYQVLSTFLTSHTPSHVVQIVGNNATQRIDVSHDLKDAFSAIQVHTLPSYRATSSWNVSPALSVPSSAWRDLRFAHYWLDDPTFQVEFSQNDLIQDKKGEIASRFAGQCPYAVPWESVRCQTVDGEELSPEALNGCIVGLCQCDGNGILSDCVGLGIVRSVDKVECLFYVITPVASEKLQDVKFLVLGSMYLPLECVFLGINGCCFPFQMEDIRPKSILGGDPMRSRNSILRRGLNT